MQTPIWYTVILVQHADSNMVYHFDTADTNIVSYKANIKVLMESYCGQENLRIIIET